MAGDVTEMEQALVDTTSTIARQWWIGSTGEVRERDCSQRTTGVVALRCVRPQPHGRYRRID